MTKNFRATLAEQMEDPRFKAEWEALEPEFQMIRTMLDAREEMAATIDKMRGGLADCDDDRPYDEIRYEALSERYGLVR